jgi:glycerate-2-kinase
MLSGGTDGEDGNVSVAGAVFASTLIRNLAVDPSSQIVARIRAAKREHNSFPVLQELLCLLEVPPTRTNVCDLRVALSAPRVRQYPVMTS